MAKRGRPAGQTRLEQLKAKQAQMPTKLFWRDHDSAGFKKRVWQERWPGDVFEILDGVEFGVLQKVCERFSIPLTQAEDD